MNKLWYILAGLAAFSLVADIIGARYFVALVDLIVLLLSLNLANQ